MTIGLYSCKLSSVIKKITFYWAQTFWKQNTQQKEQVFLVYAEKNRGKFWKRRNKISQDSCRWRLWKSFRDKNNKLSIHKKFKNIDGDGFVQESFEIDWNLLKRKFGRFNGFLHDWPCGILRENFIKIIRSAFESFWINLLAFWENMSYWYLEAFIT